MITTVRLPHNSIPDEGVAALVSCIAGRPLITELNISGNRMGSIGCKALVDMLGTRWEGGGGNRMGSTGCKALVDMLGTRWEHEGRGREPDG